jgi:argininosuccinate lyase
MLERGRSAPGYNRGPDDVHSFEQRLLVERLGDAGRRPHAAGLGDRCRLDLRPATPPTDSLPSARARRVIDVAGRASLAGDGLMPSHGAPHPAQPVLVAHFFVAWRRCARDLIA